jgi:hypothetical protein
MAESLASYDGILGSEPFPYPAFIHVRLTPERARVFQERLDALIADIQREDGGAEGVIYGVCVSLFQAPPYVQTGQEETRAGGGGTHPNGHQMETPPGK